jgi:uncharacterized membrane protein YgcG
LTTETKGATKTTEFRLTLAIIVLILISAFMIKAKSGKTDTFVAHQAWLYVAIVTGAYAVGRGLAKSGVREYPEDIDDRGGEGRGGGGERRGGGGESRRDDDDS